MNRISMLALATAAAALSAMSAAALAGNITGVTVEPANAVVGVQVKITVAGENEGICALRVEYGSGDVDVTRMNAGRDNFPRSFMRSYNKPGTYTITAKGGREGTTMGCPGEARATVTIAEAPQPVAAAAPATAAQASAPLCPEDYRLDRKSVNRKSGAFTCYASKGAIKPEKMLNCPEGTEYFMSAKGSPLGCRKPAAAKR